ncbi:MAG: DUF4892 domain-containing protein [Pseudomonas sp.]|uniref:DUF4892 domain-containing protein n=1 Tax=Pseudomonas sp. TaxID=306 RepID=UPI0027261D8F|nr:DUF4892 domain-containing protein [Pseudomonas sp.]MDO9618025.1 DUF4892 domain-containing protein [Pseudomonas sp.]MDP2447599.1 DUF4892 domain-containing protein [Pseudomonas sp.]MDZ4335463.1 DUF4892 domain-containing protein [Pseudomonas sp.]
MSHLNRYCLGLSLLLASCVVWADVAGSQDLDVLPRFAGSKIVSFKDVAEQERIYPQGAIRRISGTLRYEREVAAQGRVTAVTYELPRTHSANEVFASARETLQAEDAELLYWCVGRECGSSSLWANAVFDNATLTGSDDQQTYALLRLAEPRQDSLLALYSITRGNRRAYLHAELLTANASLGEVLPTPATLQRQLKSTGELRLVKQPEPSAAWVELLARSLKLDSTLRVTISGAQAEAWRDALVEQRVRASRLELGDADVNGVQLNVLR